MLYTIGDLHGDLSHLEHLRVRENSTIICLGDFGANFYKDEKDIKFKKGLEKYNCTFFVVRGNHEERPSNMAAAAPEKWQIIDFMGNKAYQEKAFPHIVYALDEAAIYNFDGLKTLVMGGAYSIDKYKRLMWNWPWFKDEQMTQEEMFAATELLDKYNWKVDLVLTHTCPSAFEPTELFVIPAKDVDKSMEIFFDRVERQLDYKVWCFGHFHIFKIMESDNHKALIFHSDGREMINIKSFIAQW